jgi:toxin HigB-1
LGKGQKRAGVHEGTQAFFEGKRVRAFKAFERQAMLRLDHLHAADRLMALNTPGNRLEGLKGDRKGQYSIRINEQWRICFGWPEGSPGLFNVEIVDYH